MRAVAFFGWGSMIPNVSASRVPSSREPAERRVEGGKIFGRGRRAELVGDDTQGGGLAASIDHAAYEIQSCCREYPGGAQDHRVDTGAENGAAPRAPSEAASVILSMLMISWSVASIRWRITVEPTKP